MRFRRPSRIEASINIAPLVDVVFLLVIFFAVSTTFLDNAGLRLDLPTSASTAEREARDLTVILAADGTLSFEGRTLARDELEPSLRRAIEESGRRVVVLRADSSAHHGDVVAVMDSVRAAGAEGLTVAARAAPAD